ncbi:MAG: TonB-dependent receptor [Bacteroidales bacterium]|jgi:TonB-linked SusC/RagA family outer membrane protein|nr:TonB-dependent receptor [Bacteroidales bacterium]
MFKKIRCLILGVFLSANAIAAFSQTITVSGIVRDEHGDVLPGASIAVKGGSLGTVTDLNGAYTINVPSNGTLEITFVGYVAKEEAVESRTVIDVVMLEDAAQLEEVVVIGYGSVKKSTVTSAVAKMDATAIENRPLARAENALQGQLAGVVVRTTTGEPGQDIQIRVRGAASVNASSDPLYVVDGVPMNTLMGLNPSDIESIEVLKDAASSAIYGSRGSNGVVIVSTKRGKAGKAKVSLNATYGIQSLEKKLDIMTAEEWMEFNVKSIDAKYLQAAKDRGVTNASISDPANVRFQNVGLSYTALDESLWSMDENNGHYRYIQDPRWYQYLDPSFGRDHTFSPTSESLDLLDWQDEFFKPASVSSITLNVSGGNDNTSYMFSGGYYSQDGIAHGTGYDRYSLRANIDSKINKYISAGLLLAPTYINRDGAGRANGKDTRMHHILMYTPVAPAGQGYRLNAEPYAKYGWANGEQPNPYVYMDNLRHDNMLRMMGNAFIRITPLDGLKIEFSGSANYYDLDGQTYTYSNTLLTWQQGEGANSSGGHNTDRSWSTLLQALANYDKSFGKHNVSVMLGASSEQSNLGYATTQDYGRPFPNDAITGTFDESTLAVTNSNVTQKTPNRLASFFGRVSYNYAEKYLISGSLRYDGGSVFGTDNKWGVFPAFSAGWNVSREQFFQDLNLSWLNNLKLRASYGATGNNSISNTAAYPTLTSANYAGFAGYYANSLGNMDLGWEKTNSTDLAVDLGFLKNRIQLSFDWYTKTTTDLLYQVPSMGASGFSTTWDNMGEIQNKGFEIELNTANFTGKFTWSTSFNLSYNKNKVISIGVSDTPIYSGFNGIGNNNNSSNILEVGRPANNFFMFEAIGVWKSQSELDAYAASIGKTAGDLKFDGKQLYPGDLRYRDVNGDGLWDRDHDRVYLGNPMPSFTYGMTNRFSYKNFDLSILLTAQTGGKIYGALGRAIDRPSMRSNMNVMDKWTNAWWSENDPGDGSTPYILSATTGGTVDSRWLWSSDYFRIKNITLGYKIPIKPEIISNLHVYVSIENLKKWDNYYNGFSPESANTASSAVPGGTGALGIDYGGYPIARVVTFGLNVNF